MAAVAVIRNGNTQCLQGLIKAGIDVNKHFEGHLGYLLMGACHYPPCLRLLIANKADVNVQNHLGINALIVAISDNAPAESVNLLLANGANVNHADWNGNTALLWAASVCRIEYISRLIKYGADVMVFLQRVSLS